MAHKQTHCKNGHELVEGNLVYPLKENGKRGRRCRTCINEYMKNRMQKFKRDDPEGSHKFYKNVKLKEHYGVTLEYFENLRKNQNNKCAICYEEFSEDKKPCMDHCHTSKKIRGLLCHSCNRALGLLHENVKTLENMINYIILY